MKRNLVGALVMMAALTFGTAVPSFAGAVGGPKGGTYSVNAFDTDSFNVTFRAGEMAYINVVGDGDTDLDLFIYDDLGNKIVSDTGYSDNCSVSMYVYRTSVFTIKVANRGDVYNVYRISTN